MVGKSRDAPLQLGFTFSAKQGIFLLVRNQMADGGQQNEQCVEGLNVMKGLIIYSGLFFWTPPAYVMYSIALRIRVKV